MRHDRRLRAIFVGVALALGSLAPVVAAPPAFCAGDGRRAVLVVDRENGSAPLRMCVSLPGGDVSGLELIRLAGDQYDLQYRFGHGGAAVCQLANVPAQRPPSDCLRQGHPFWGYWRSDGGGWQWSGSGAASTEVEAGDVEGWSFGMGNDGSSHPRPPETRASDVCRPIHNGGGSGSGSGPGGGSGGAKKPGGSSDRPGGGSDGGSGPDGASGGGTSEGAPADDTPGSTPVPQGNGPDAKPGQDGPDGRAPDDRTSTISKERRMRLPEYDGSGDAPAPVDISSASPDALPAGATSAEDEGAGSDFPVMGLVALGAAVAMGTAAAVVGTRRRRKGAR